MSYLKNNFNGGEVGGALRYRADLAKHPNSEELLENFIVLPQGGCENRAGTELVKTGVGANPIRLIPFQFNNTERFALEFGDKYIKVHRGDAADLATITTGVPFRTGELDDISFAQKNDILFIAHPNYPPRMLKRYSDTNWAIEVMSVKGGPWLDPGDDNADITVTPAAKSGNSVGIEASADYFTADMVGGKIRLLHTRDTNGIRHTFEGDEDIRSTSPLVIHGAWHLYTSGTWIGILRLYRSYDNGATWKLYKAYESTANDNVDDSGYEDESNVLFGLEFSGWQEPPEGVRYQCLCSLTHDNYQHEGSGTITGYTDAKHVAVKVEFDFWSTDPTEPGDWSISCWNDHQGYPALVGFYSGDRLYFAATKQQPQTIWMSRVGDYDNFSEGTLAEDAITMTLNTGYYNSIRWIAELGDKLYCGCANGLIRIGSTENDRPLEPGKCRAVITGGVGTAPLPAIAAGEALLFVRRGGRSLMEFAYQYSDDVYRTPDMNILNPDILAPGVKDIQLRQSPFPMLMCLLNSGEIACFTYNRVEEVMAWSRISFAQDGFCESFCVLDTDGRDDEVYYCIRRGNKRSIERQLVREDGSADTACFLDKSVTVPDGPERTTFQLSTLAGDTVTVLVDGAVVPDVPVAADGTLELPFAARRITAGLPYTSVMRTLPLEVAQGVQGSLAQVKKCVEMVIKFRNTYGGEARLLSGGQQRELAVRHAGGALDAPVDAQSNELALTLYSRSRYEQQIEVRQTLPLPMTILAIVAEIE